MAFKRAQWHSGLTYMQQCPVCHTKMKYTDYSLDFRPWYADGYVDCPKCKAHLRHRETYAVNEDGTYVNSNPNPSIIDNHQGEPEVKEGFAYCTNCGKTYKIGEDHFCSRCGKKLD